MPQIVKKRSGTLAKEAAYDDRGQYASWNLPGSFSEGSGCLPGLSWARLGRVLAALGPFLDSFWMLLGVSSMGTFCALLEHSWSHLGSHGCLRPRFWRVFGASGLGVGELHWQFSPLFLAMPFSCRHGFYVMHELLRSTARHSTAQGQHWSRHVLEDTFCKLLEHSWSRLGSHGCLRPRSWRVFGVSGLGVGKLQLQFSPWFWAMPCAGRH